MFSGTGRKCSDIDPIKDIEVVYECTDQGR